MKKHVQSTAKRDHKPLPLFKTYCNNDGHSNKIAEQKFKHYTQRIPPAGENLKNSWKSRGRRRKENNLITNRNMTKEPIKHI